MVVREPGVVEGESEASLGSRVHVLVLTVAGVQPHHVTVIAHRVGVAGRTAERLGPVGRQPLQVFRMLTWMRL